MLGCVLLIKNHQNYKFLITRTSSMHSGRDNMFYLYFVPYYTVKHSKYSLIWIWMKVPSLKKQTKNWNKVVFKDCMISNTLFLLSLLKHVCCYRNCLDFQSPLLDWKMEINPLDTEKWHSLRKEMSLFLTPPVPIAKNHTPVVYTPPLPGPREVTSSSTDCFQNPLHKIEK